MSDPVILDPWAGLRRFTPARIALGRTGDSLPTDALLDFGVAHAAARDAVQKPLDVALLESQLADVKLGSIRAHSAARDRAVYMRRPDLGRRLDSDSRVRLARQPVPPQLSIVFIVADGLSAFAPERHAVTLLQHILSRLSGLSIAPIVIAEQSRVALGDEVGELWNAHFVAMLIGERPGLSSPDSLGVYLTFQPRQGRTDAERNCISNIRPGGLSYEAAARKFEFLFQGARRLGATGVTLKDESDAGGELLGGARRLDLPHPVREG